MQTEHSDKEDNKRNLYKRKIFHKKSPDMKIIIKIL